MVYYCHNWWAGVLWVSWSIKRGTLLKNCSICCEMLLKVCFALPARRWKLHPHCERASPALWKSFARTVKELPKRWNIQFTPFFFGASFSFHSKERLSIVWNYFYFCKLYGNSILSVSTFSSSLTVRVFLASFSIFAYHFTTNYIFFCLSEPCNVFSM